MHKASTTFPFSNHPLARKVRSNVELNGRAFSVAMPDVLPKKKATMAEAMVMSMEMDMKMSKKRKGNIHV